MLFSDGFDDLKHPSKHNLPRMRFGLLLALTMAILACAGNIERSVECCHENFHVESS